MQTGTMLSEGRLGRAQRLCTSARNGGKGRCRPANKCIRAAQRFHSSSEASSSDSTRGERRSVPERCRVKVLQGLAAATTSHLGVSHAAQADAIESIQAGSQLIQKDSIIAVAFGTAILALGAVTIGVRFLNTGMLAKISEIVKSSLLTVHSQSTDYGFYQIECILLSIQHQKICLKEQTKNHCKISRQSPNKPSDIAADLSSRHLSEACHDGVWLPIPKWQIDSLFLPRNLQGLRMLLGLPRRQVVHVLGGLPFCADLERQKDRKG